MWEDLQEIRSLGITVRDIHPGNYIGGKLIDFSRAWTMNHPCLDWTEPRDLKDNLIRDARDLEELVYSWAATNQPPNGTKGYKVKPPKGPKECAAGSADWLDANPTLYDWRKWEEDPEAIDAFIYKELVESVAKE
ncbi:hypothetical protein QBC38DRAFT_505739 [Podospora fimiseda]|uniref:Uncharacterized protein n=1 Tax=Podospora fimiseda TaxID=252190 RepID=A0AAN7BEI8_9PEZI|nr:hypothetical protein QBC38DRAFT_505739 [Podospora fimiseda]